MIVITIMRFSWFFPVAGVRHRREIADLSPPLEELL